MGETIYNLAFDFGASSGRMILSKYADGKIELEELHRFSNDPVRIGKNFYWDTFRLYHELKQGLKKAAAREAPDQESGYRYLGSGLRAAWTKTETSSETPSTTVTTAQSALSTRLGKIVPLKRDLCFHRYPVHELQHNCSSSMRIRKCVRTSMRKQTRLLFMPELFGYLLTGKMYNEYTMASTGRASECKDPRLGLSTSSRAAGLRTDIFGELVQPGNDHRRPSSGGGRGDRSFRREGHRCWKP